MILLHKYTRCLLLLSAIVNLVSCKVSNELTVVNSKAVPAAIGPYSHSIKIDNLIFCSGQIGLSPSTGELAGDDISSQTKQALQNMKFILEEAGSDLSHITKVTVFVTDMKNYTLVNEIYSLFFDTLKPARSVVQVAGLPKGALIEIECIAVTK